MAITPYTTPTQYQYKPLNLMAFAEPLMKMQEKYDLTKAALEEADVKATALQYGADPIKAKELENLYRTKRDEIVTNLMESKNYTQAASQLKQLNRLWKEDPQRIALETNYNTFLERDKEEAARVGKPAAQGGITKEQYLQWRAEEIRKFTDAGGTNYRETEDFPTGTYNVITGKVGRETDMSKELEELKYKVASDIEAGKFTGAMQALGIDPLVGDAKFKITDYEKLSRAEIEAKVEEYIKQQDRFKPFLEEKAYYDFNDILYAKDGGAKFNKTTEELLSKNMSANDNYIKYLEKEGKKDTPEYTNALKVKAFLLEQIDNPDPEVIRGLFTQSELNRQYDASALGKIFEVNNSKTSYTFRDLPDTDSGDGSGGLFDKNAAVVNPTTDEKTYVGLQNIYNTSRSNVGSLVAKNNRVGGDKTFALREISMGTKDSKLRIQMEKNPAMALPRQQQILAIAARSNNATEFHRNLWNAGFKSANEKNSAVLWNVLSDTKYKGAIADNIEAGLNDYYNMENALNQLEEADQKSLTDKTFLAEVDKMGTVKHVVPESLVKKFADKVGKSVDELMRMGVVSTQTGFKPNGGGEFQEFLLDGNRIARTFGYKTLEEAVSKGVDFSSKGVKGLGTSLNVLQKEASKRVYSAQEMGQVFSNDTRVDKILTPMVPNAQALASFKPLKGTWDNVPGFSENGSPMAGTEIVGAPQISVRGNQVFLRVTYNYKNPVDTFGKGNLQNSVEVRIKPEQRNQIEESLNRISLNAYQNKNNSDASNQIYETAVRALYLMNTPEPSTRQSAKVAEVNSTSREAVLETRVGSNGVRYEVVKRYVGEGVPDIYVARMVGPGGKQPIKVDGKELKSHDIEKIHSVLGELMDLRSQ